MNVYLNGALLGMGKLASMIKPNGEFIYREVNGKDKKGQYNLLRHAGSVWAMVDVAKRLNVRGLLSPDDLAFIKRQANKAMKRLLKDYGVKTYEHGKPLKVLLWKGDFKLGANALAVLAMLELGNKEEAIQLGRGLLKFRLPNGDFIHKMDWKEKKELDFRSDYYTGEIMFALARLTEETGMPEFLAAAIKAEELLGSYSPKYGVKEQSHWMLYALSCLLKVDGSAVVHSLDIAQDIFHNKEYLNWGRSTPIACRVEGLMALAKGIGPESSTRVRILETAKDHCDMLLKWMLPDGGVVNGDLNPEVRIDYIQHSISALMSYGEAHETG